VEGFVQTPSPRVVLARLHLIDEPEGTQELAREGILSLSYNIDVKVIDYLHSMPDFVHILCLMLNR
jgi:hypothetical protein